MKVRWTKKAQQHLADIHNFIAKDSEDYANKTVTRILKRSKQIAKYPNSGRMVPEFDSPDIREVIEGPYRLIYTVRTEAIYIVAVFHAAKQPPWT